MVANMLWTVTLTPTSGIAHDESVSAYAFQGATTVGAMLGPVSTALATCYNALGTYIAGSMSHTVVTYRGYDITGHEDGSPHGSPVDVLTGAITASAGNPTMGQGLAVCVSLRSSGYALAPVSGPSGAIPTDDFAQDEGAPATHPGLTRPKKRTEGRVFIGPLDRGVDSATTAGGPGAAPMTAMRAAIFAMAATGLCVWSRRDGTLRPVVECATKGLYSYQRLRNPRPTAYTLTP